MFSSIVPSFLRSKPASSFDCERSSPAFTSQVTTSEPLGPVEPGVTPPPPSAFLLAALTTPTSQQAASGTPSPAVAEPETSGEAVPAESKPSPEVPAAARGASSRGAAFFAAAAAKLGGLAAACGNGLRSAGGALSSAFQALAGSVAAFARGCKSGLLKAVDVITFGPSRRARAEERRQAFAAAVYFREVTRPQWLKAHDAAYRALRAADEAPSASQSVDELVSHPLSRTPSLEEFDADDVI